MSNGFCGGVMRTVAIALIAAVAPLPAAASDPVARAAIRDEMLARINADRRAAGLSLVRLDTTLSGPADGYCERQLAERTVGHFGMDGLAPYVRYSQAGLNDGLAENAVAWSAQYVFTPAAALDLARRSHAAMMAEEPPADSHRRTILDPHATHVAIGSAWSAGEFRLVQIFVRRYIDWNDPPPRRARAGERMRASGRAAAGWDIAGASIHYEPLPPALSRERANGIESYALPPPSSQLRPRRPQPRGAERRSLSEWVASGASDGELLVTPAGGFSLAAPLDRGAGIYTLVVWLRGPSDGPIAAAHISTIASDAPHARPGMNDAPAGR